MAADYIVVNRTKQLGNGLVRAAGLLRELRDLVDNLNDVGQHCFNAGDYTLLEAQFGLATGAGANTLTLLAQVNTLLNTNATIAGQTRLDQLDEFVARLNGQ